ncbi:hypothetical protein [Brevibacillus brevis]|uniref:Uncharacterized protein n=1 Tax=Brevibacillus brevis TaxID=1393 RepID=A0ABY9SX75_BREBE|nr:hypothetical protein [Brevibacillus brevis]WNC12440.1 hypothetical protein RGB73_17040 [Brevibacillus brevis]
MDKNGETMGAAFIDEFVEFSIYMQPKNESEQLLFDLLIDLYANKRMLEIEGKNHPARKAFNQTAQALQEILAK